ncbi:branched-chain amino acid ABC transporter permease [Candidatus Woesearchaeota archaeon]|nr:branched-chain amino acid ABC transporter permease [Candidatus Woesearchaeota archaeon]
MAHLIAQLIFNGIIAGAVYALVASGFSLIYKVARFMHVAHGGVLAVAAYLFWTFSQVLALWLAVPAAILAAGIVGWMLNSIYARLRRRNASGAVLLIASIALLLFINALVLAIWGAGVKTIPITNPVFDVGVRITLVQGAIIVVAALMFASLAFMMKRTRLGKAMRALADNEEVAQTVGINPARIRSMAFLAGSMLAGVAGVLVALEQNLYPAMGVPLILNGFTGAVIGGLSSVHGAVLGALLLGLVENIGIWWLPSGYKGAIAFALLFVFLLFKPQGLLGARMREA